MSREDDFARMFNMPPAMQPYVNLVVNDQEMDVVLGIDDRSLTDVQIAELIDTTVEETFAVLKRMVQRDVLVKEGTGGQTKYRVGKFYDTMDYWTSYETGSWLRLPQWTRHAVDEWQLQEFIKLHTLSFEIIAKDPDAWLRMKNRDILLLEEALELVEASEYVCLLPCPCKTTVFPGSPVIEGSMRLGARARETLEKGQGRSLTTEEAKTHLLSLDRMGLIHTGPKAWREHDPSLEWVSHGNCNVAYSFPFRAGLRLGLAKAYPRVHYVAAVNWDQCTFCGICLGRCPFGALYHDGSTISVHGQKFRALTFKSENCFGCGLCANTCPENAILMQPV